jgi:hypothetical protein
MLDIEKMSKHITKEEFVSEIMLTIGKCPSDYGLKDNCKGNCKECMINSLESYNFKNELKKENCKDEIIELDTALTCQNGGLFTLSQVNSITNLNTMLNSKIEQNNMLHIPMKFKKGDTIYTIKSIKDENICNTCNGEKKIIYNGTELVCPNCSGTGKIISNRLINVVIDEPFIIESVQVKLDSELKPTLKYKGKCGYAHLNRAEDNLFSIKEEAQKRCDKLNIFKTSQAIEYLNQGKTVKNIITETSYWKAGDKIYVQNGNDTNWYFEDKTTLPEDGKWKLL